MSAMLPTMALCRLYTLRPTGLSRLSRLCADWTEDWLPLDPAVAGVWIWLCACVRGAPGVMGDTGLPSVEDTAENVDCAEGEGADDW